MNTPPRLPFPSTIRPVCSQTSVRLSQSNDTTKGGDPGGGDSSIVENLDEDEIATDNQDNHVDPEEDSRTSPFSGLCVAKSTAALWGRRIASVTTSDSAAFAVSELGEVRARCFFVSGAAGSFSRPFFPFPFPFLRSLSGFAAAATAAAFCSWACMAYRTCVPARRRCRSKQWNARLLCTVGRLFAVHSA